MRSTRRELLWATVGSLGAVAAVPGAGDDRKKSIDAPKGPMPAARSRLACRVARGGFDHGDAAAVAMTLEDLRTYWERAFGQDSFLLDAEGPERKADLELLIGSSENLPRHRALVEGGTLRAAMPAVESRRRLDG